MAEEILAEVSKAIDFVNGAALELYKVYQAGAKNISVDMMANWFAQASGVDKVKINERALLSKLVRLKQNYSLKRGLQREKLLQEKFIVPEEYNYKVKPTVQTDESTCTLLNMDLAAELSMMKKSHCQTVSRLRDNETVLRQKLKTSQHKLNERRGTVCKLREELKQTTRKLERRQTSASMWKKSSTVDKTELLETHKTDVNLKGKNEQLEKDKKMLTVELNKCTSQLDIVTDELHNTTRRLNTINSELEQKKDDVLELEECNQYLEDIVKDNLSLDLFDDDKKTYTPECVKTVMSLLECGVATSKVGKVMTTMGKLCGRNIEHLLSRYTCDRINQRRLAVAQQQMAELEDEENITLYTDETSKYGKKYMVYATSTSSHSVRVLGLKPIATKSAQDTLDTLVDILHEISTTCKNASLGDSIISNIRNTMSDRAATEKLFNKMLSEYREKLLPVVVADFDKLTEEQQAKASIMNNFFCGLHLMVTFAENFAQCIREIEPDDIGACSSKDNKRFTNRTESHIIRFIRTVCKLFSRGADEKSGCYDSFTTFLASKGKVNILTEFKHNRFNILFYDGGAVYHLLEDIEDFIHNIHGTPNTLVKAVLLDCKEAWCRSGARALGLLSKYITTPLWRMLEDKQVHIGDMGPVYSELVVFLEQRAASAEDVALFMQGNDMPSLLEQRVQIDDVTSSLTKSTDQDDMVNDILRHVFSNWSKLLGRLVADHLHSGKFHDMDEDQRLQTASTIKHNKLAEELFAHMDRLVRLRPRATCLTNEAHIIFGKNKTDEWLETKSPEEQSKILESSRQQATGIKRNFKETMSCIKKRREEILRTKQTAIVASREKHFREKEDLTRKMIHYGLWQTENEVEDKLCSLPTIKEKIAALKTQITFRKVVLEQPVSDKTLFNFSSKGLGTFGIARLKANVLTLIRASCHLIEQTEKDNPGSMLVGQRVQHKFENEDGSSQWYHGKVISQVPGFLQWFNIIYNDDDCVYTYRLLDDLSDGDLKIEVTSLDSQDGAVAIP